MNIQARPIIPAQLRGLDHFKHQEEIVYIQVIDLRSIKIHTIKVRGVGDGIVMTQSSTRNLDMRIQDPTILGLREFRFLKDVTRDKTHWSFMKFFTHINTEHTDIDHVCIAYYLQDLKRRHGENIDMDLFFRMVQSFEFPGE